MSDAINQLKLDIETAMSTATQGLPPDTKDHLGRIVARGLDHIAAGRYELAHADSVTIEAILFREGNERAKATRDAVLSAIARAIINGGIAAI